MTRLSSVDSVSVFRKVASSTWRLFVRPKFDLDEVDVNPTIPDVDDSSYQLVGGSLVGFEEMTTEPNGRGPSPRMRTEGEESTYDLRRPEEWRFDPTAGYVKVPTWAFFLASALIVAGGFFILLNFVRDNSADQVAAWASKRNADSLALESSQAVQQPTAPEPAVVTPEEPPAATPPTKPAGLDALGGVKASPLLQRLGAR